MNFFQVKKRLVKVVKKLKTKLSLPLVVALLILIGMGILIFSTPEERKEFILKHKVPYQVVTRETEHFWDTYKVPDEQTYEESLLRYEKFKEAEVEAKAKCSYKGDFETAYFSWDEYITATDCMAEELNTYVYPRESSIPKKEDFYLSCVKVDVFNLYQIFGFTFYTKELPQKEKCNL